MSDTQRVFVGVIIVLGLWIGVMVASYYIALAMKRRRASASATKARLKTAVDEREHAAKELLLPQWEACADKTLPLGHIYDGTDGLGGRSTYASLQRCLYCGHPDSAYGRSTVAQLEALSHVAGCYPIATEAVPKEALSS